MPGELRLGLFPDFDRLGRFHSSCPSMSVMAILRQSTHGIVVPVVLKSPSTLEVERSEHASDNSDHRP